MDTTSSTPALAGPTPGVEAFTPVQLLRLTQLFASDPALADTLGPDLERPGERSWRLLADSPQLQVWLIRWPVGTGTGWHDHGGARGGFTVVRGTHGVRALPGEDEQGELRDHHPQPLPGGELDPPLPQLGEDGGPPFASGAGGGADAPREAGRAGVDRGGRDECPAGTDGDDHRARGDEAADASGVGAHGEQGVGRLEPVARRDLGDDPRQDRPDDRARQAGEDGEGAHERDGRPADEEHGADAQPRDEREALPGEHHQPARVAVGDHATEEQAEHVRDRLGGDDEREGAGVGSGQVEHPEGQCHRCEGEPEHRQGARGEERGEASLAQQTQVLAHRAHRRKIPPEGEGGVTAAT